MAEEEKVAEKENTSGDNPSIVCDFKAKDENFKAFESLSLECDSKNDLLISCIFCKSKILKPKIGTLVDKEVHIHMQLK